MLQQEAHQAQRRAGGLGGVPKVGGGLGQRERDREAAWCAAGRVGRSDRGREGDGRGDGGRRANASTALARG